jgi:hypothetical protein
MKFIEALSCSRGPLGNNNATIALGPSRVKYDDASYVRFKVALNCDLRLENDVYTYDLVSHFNSCQFEFEGDPAETTGKRNRHSH